MISKLLSAVSVLIIATSLSAKSNKNNVTTTQKCSTPPTVMLSLLMAESGGKRELGYPYVIRINGNLKGIASKALDTLVAKKVISKIYTNVYDCKNQDKCTQISRLLISNGIANLDLGAFQVNYFYHPNNKIEDFWVIPYEGTKIPKLLK